MAYTIQFQLQEDVLCFEIIGNLCNHLDSIAKYVVYRIAKSRTANVLIDLRRAIERPGPAKLFIHVLRYPLAHHVQCALVDLGQNEEFVSLYLKLMRHRGHKIRFFANPDDGKAWLRTAQNRVAGPGSKTRLPATQNLSEDDGTH
jgi:hypothetical protein